MLYHHYNKDDPDIFHKLNSYWVLAPTGRLLVSETKYILVNKTKCDVSLLREAVPFRRVPSPEKRVLPSAYSLRDLDNTLQQDNKRFAEVFQLQQPSTVSTKTKSGGCISVFIPYAHQDKGLKDEIEQKVSILRRLKWNIDIKPCNVSRSSDWKDDNLLVSSAVILLIVTENFLDTEFCYSLQLNKAIERHRSKTSIVLPILFERAVFNYLDETPFAKIEDKSPCNDRAVDEYRPRKIAMYYVTGHIKAAIKTMLLGS